MLTGEVKKKLIDVLTVLVERHRAARAAVTDEVFVHELVLLFLIILYLKKIIVYRFGLLQMVDAFMAVRPLPNMFN